MQHKLTCIESVIPCRTLAQGHRLRYLCYKPSTVLVHRLQGAGEGPKISRQASRGTTWYVDQPPR